MLIPKKLLLKQCLFLALIIYSNPLLFAQTSQVEIYVNWPKYSSENLINIYDASGANLLYQYCDDSNSNACYSGNGNTSYSNTWNLGCLTDGTYIVSMADYYSDGWQGANSSIIITSGGNTVFSDNGPANGQNYQAFYFTVSGGGGTCGDICAGVGGGSNCCSETLVGNPGFEDSFSKNEKFPNSILTTTNNAATGDFSEWSFADGGYNTAPQQVIQDASRASEGSQFVHMPLPPNPSVFNYCVGNSLTYSPTVTQCEDDTWFEDMRYVFRMDYVPFNRAHPEGGIGQAYPACEHNVGGFFELEMYDKYGDHLGAETAVAWNDVANSWKRAYAVSGKLSGNQAMVVWVSLHKNSTTGILLDNTYLAPLRIFDAGVVESTCGSANNEIEFALNPISNVLSVPGIDYVVCPPSGYTVSPEKGTYGEITYFTLTSDSGNFSNGSPTSISLTVTDEVNTDCVVTAEIENPYPYCQEPVAAIGNLVWIDEDADGLFSEGERGIPNVKVLLQDEDQITLKTTTTDANGEYIFKDLSTDLYFVTIDETTLPTGMYAIYDEDSGISAPDHKTYITLSGEEYLTANFGYNFVSKSDSDNPTTMNETGTIGDRIWHDVNMNGIQDIGESGITGIKVELLTDPNLDGVYTTSGTQSTTDEAGYYIFDNLIPGAYMLQVNEDDLTNAGFEILPTADPDSDSNNVTRPIIIAPGDVWLRGDFGYVSTAPLFDIGSYIYVDENGNGIFDSGNDQGIEGVSVSLFLDTNDNNEWDENDEAIASTITSSDGAYMFSGVSSGEYMVVVTDVENLLQELHNIGDPDGSIANESAVTVNGANQLLENFGYAPVNHSIGKGLIGDFVFLDADGGGDFDMNEKGIEGIWIQLIDDGTGSILAATQTNELGKYFFGNLSDGTYRIKIDISKIPSGLEVSYDADGSSPADGEGGSVTISSGSRNLNQDFGLKASTSRTLSGTIWNDTDANGTLHLDEAVRFDGIKLIVTNESGLIIGSTISDAQGNYSFAGLPSEILTLDLLDESGILNGYWQSIGTDAEADNLTVDLTGGNVSGVDFGFYSQGAALGNLVWLDYNNNGIQEDNEPGLEGAKLTLGIDYDNDGTDEITSVVISGMTGEYCFENLLIDEDYQGDGTGSEPNFTLNVERPNDAFVTSVNVNVGNDNLDSDTPTNLSVNPQKGRVDVSLDNISDSQSSIDFAFDFDCTRPSVEYAVTSDGTDPNPTSTTTYLLNLINGQMCHTPDNLPYGTIRSYTYCLHGDWRYYFNPLDPDEYLFAIRMNSNTTEIEYIELRIDDSTDDRLVVGANSASYVMMRDWYVQTVDNQPLNSSVDIRFYFPPNEFEKMYNQAVEQATNAWGTGQPEVGSIEWFKKDIFDPENDITETGDSLISNSITNLQTLETNEEGENSIDNNMDGLQPIGNNKNHIQFNGITGFSGGTAVLPINKLALPVELSKFEGRAENCKNILSWTSESELNFDYYDIEWSSNGAIFSSIEKIESKNTNVRSSYDIEHTSNASKNYYRLKMVDIDGSFEYSNIIVIEAKCYERKELSIFPNPVSNSEFLNIEYSSNQPSAYVEIYDILGKRIQVIELQKSSDLRFNHQLDIHHLNSGIYTMRVMGENIIKSFIIE